VTTTGYGHIEFTDDGVPRIEGARIKVVEIVLDHVSHRWDAEEIQRQHPHLTLGQIYSALAYYADHQAEMDDRIREDVEEVERIRRERGDGPPQAKLDALKHATKLRT
jgi:uncharacterized protein (DUF433 family)